MLYKYRLNDTNITAQYAHSAIFCGKISHLIDFLMGRNVNNMTVPHLSPSAIISGYIRNTNTSLSRAEMDVVL